MSKGKFLWLVVLQLFLPFDVLETDEYRSFFNFICLFQATGTCEMPNAPCRKEHDAKILTDYAIEAAFGYPIFVTQHTASSNCFCCKRCSFGDILCLALDSFLIFGLLILKKGQNGPQDTYIPKCNVAHIEYCRFPNSNPVWPILK